MTPGGNRIVYDYNRLNQLAEKTCHNTGELENDRPVRMGYNGLGQRISMEDITGESAHAYDSLGRLKTATNGSGKVVEYVYDEADNLSGILYPDDYSVLYEYDKNDNITKLTDRDGRDTCICGELISNYQYTYDDGGLITKEVAKENLFTSGKDYGHTGGASDKCSRSNW